MGFLDKASEAIRASGGRMTPQRQVIIEVLSTASDHLDADGLYQLAHERDAGINLATVYRTLSVLESAGLVRQHYISPEHDRKYYSINTRLYHFTCRSCHRVFSFQTDLVEELKRNLEQMLNVQALNACVCVDGLCPDCQAQQELTTSIISEESIR